MGAATIEMWASMPPLTDSQCKTAAPAEKDYKLSDAGGLYLFITSRGHKSWRLKYRFGGKEKRLVLGPYPGVKAPARSRSRFYGLASEPGIERRQHEQGEQGRRHQPAYHHGR